MFKFPNYNIILPKYLEIVKKKGSSLALPANGLGGSRATSLLVAHFALQNTASNSAKKKNRPREGVAACLRKTMAGKKGGGGGEFRHARASCRPYFCLRTRFRFLAGNYIRSYNLFLVGEFEGGKNLN